MGIFNILFSRKKPEITDEIAQRLVDPRASREKLFQEYLKTPEGQKKIDEVKDTLNKPKEFDTGENYKI